MNNTLPKLGNELPNTDEVERVAAALVCTHRRRLHAGEAPEVRMTITYTKLQSVWAVDFYRGRPTDRNPT